MPAHRSDEHGVPLPGADDVVLRAIRPEDRAAYASFIARIDAADLRRRFFQPAHVPGSDLAIAHLHAPA